jgi:hypothetical protein
VKPQELLWHTCGLHWVLRTPEPLAVQVPAPDVMEYDQQTWDCLADKQKFNQNVLEVT